MLDYEDLISYEKQEKFLANDKNKIQFIEMLKKCLVHENFVIKQAKDDADTLIVSCPPASTSETVIIGEDLDLLIILVATAPCDRKIYLLKPARQNHHCCMQEELAQIILFVHAFSVCDTTSAIFGKGKIKLLKLLQKRKDLQELISIFENSASNKQDIIQAGEKVFVAVYESLKSKDSLNICRYHMFIKTSSKKKFNLATLPPSASAAQQHSFRVYHQIKKWLGNDLPAEEWGWKNVENQLSPIATLLKPALSNLLDLISCNCKKQCSSLCSCRKAGLECSPICGFCNCINCTTFPSIFDIDEDDCIPQDNEDQLEIGE